MSHVHGRYSAFNGSSSKPELKQSLTKFQQPFSFFFLAEIDKLILKKLYRIWSSQDSPNNFEKESKIEGVSNFQTYSEATVIEVVWCKCRHVQQRNKSPESGHKPSLLWGRGSRLRCWGNPAGRRQSFWHMVLGWPDVHVRKDEFRTILSRKLNRKWIADMWEQNF